jgi:hypothetical protein
VASKHEKDFIDQYTRRCLVTWALQTVQRGELVVGSGNQLFYEHARAKGWISADGTKVIGKGFGTAASFLRR